MAKIIGKRFLQARESQGLSIEELAAKTTFSNRQIQQIEEGGDTAFYTPAIKLKSARVVADILGLNHEVAFEDQKILRPQPAVLTAIENDSISTMFFIRPNNSTLLIYWSALILALFGIGWQLTVLTSKEDQLVGVSKNDSPNLVTQPQEVTIGKTIKATPSVRKKEAGVAEFPLKL